MRDMCVIDWSAVADWANVGISFLTLVAGVIALVLWRVQLRGGTKHQAANEIAEAARTLRYAFYDARSPMILAGEFPPSYRLRASDDQLSNTDRADEYAHAYRGRSKEFWIHLLALVRLRAKAGAILTDDVADAVEKLAKTARRLDDHMKEHVKQLRAGPEVVAMWPDQDFVREAQEGVAAVRGSEDAYSLAFETALKALSDLLRPYM